MGFRKALYGDGGAVKSFDDVEDTQGRYGFNDNGQYDYFRFKLNAVRANDG